VNQAGGSKRHHNGVLVNGTHYMRRVDPEHRVEGGHRVVDIDQDIFPVLNVEARSSYQEGAVSRLDFTGVIEEHNEAHHRQKMLELPTLDCLQLDLDLGLGIGNSSQQEQQQPEAPPPRRVDSVIRAVPVPVAEQVHTHQPPPSAGPQRHPDDRTKGDLIAEKLKLLASDRSDEGFASKKNQEDGADQDLLSLLGEPQLMLQQPTMDSLNNFMWEVKEEEVSPS